jgi:hypothetical protein
MPSNANTAAGRTPTDWRERLEKASCDPTLIKEELRELECEMRQERSWLHENPAPGGLIKSIMGFLQDDQDDNYQRLADKIQKELSGERRLVDKYRSWLPGETAKDRLCLYLKDFGGMIELENKGAQFPGFIKYQGFHENAEVRESYIFYLNEKFPGRDPANFHVVFVKETGAVIIKRVYRMELPRVKGKSAAREVLKEMICELVPDILAVTELEVDNAANVETRKALMKARTDSKGAVFALRSDADPAQTPLGHLMVKLMGELGVTAGDFKAVVLPFGMLKIELFVK